VVDEASATSLDRRSVRVSSHKSLDLSPKEIERAFADSRWAESFPPILNVEQAAQLLRHPKATIYSWSSQGLLSSCSTRAGKKLLFWRNRLIEKIFNEGLRSEK
jgi:hypothetical protein